MKNYIRNFGYLACVMAYVIGTIAGIGNCVMIGEYFTACAIAILSAMAFPMAYYFFTSIGNK